MMTTLAVQGPPVAAGPVDQAFVDQVFLDLMGADEDLIGADEDLTGVDEEWLDVEFAAIVTGGDADRPVALALDPGRGRSSPVGPSGRLLDDSAFEGVRAGLRIGRERAPPGGLGPASAEGTTKEVRPRS